MIELTGNRLYQWEIGRELTGFDGTHAQFANKGDSIAEIYSVADGKIKIPDKYLQSGRDLIVFDCNVDENNEVETILSTRIFPVQDKPKPKHYTPTEAAEALGIVKRLTEEAKEAAANAVEAEERSREHAQDAYNEANRAKQYAEKAESASNRALIVTFSQEDYYADCFVSDILTAAESGRDVFLKLPGAESYLPLESVDEDGWYAQFCRYYEKNVLVYEIRDDSMVTINTISLDRLDDSTTDTSHVWSSQKIVREIESRGAKIDDSKIGADAWSSKNIIDKLSPSFEKSGILVQCEPVEGYPLSVSAKEDSEIEGVTVTVCGKNLYDKTKYPLDTAGYPYSSNTSSAGIFSRSDTYRRTGFIPVVHLRGQTIALNHPPSKYVTVANPGISFYKYVPNLQKDEDCKTAWCGGTIGASIKVPDNAEYMVFCVRKQDSPIGSEPKDIQIEIGSQATAYEPYHKDNFVAYGDVAGDFIPVEGVVGKTGIMTFFAHKGMGEVTDVKVSGKADPVAIIEKLTNAVISLGGNL